MKIIKAISLVIGSLILIVLSVIIGAIIIDNQDTSYLHVDDNPEFESNSYLIKNVNIIPMTADTILQNQTVSIQDGLIAEIAKEIPISDLAIIDGEGGYLSPGMIDMHVHVWDEYELGLYLANGVTTVRNLWGQPMHLRMKEAINDQELIGPLFYTSGPKLTGPEFIGDDNLQLFTPEEAQKKVIDYKERGYDFIKTYYGLTEELFDAILEQGQKSGMDIVAHPTPKVSYDYHFNPQIITIEHAEEFVQQPLNYQLDTVKLIEIIDGYAANPHTTLCPTLIVFYNIYEMLIDDNILSSDEMNLMNPLIRMVDSQAQFDRWSGTKSNDSLIVEKIKLQHDFHLLIVKKLHERGVNIVAGTDAGIGVTPAGTSMHQELDFYTQAGMSNYEALKTATVNPSKTHDFLNDLGTIQVSKIANLILTKENPLANLKTLRRPELVMVRGRKITPQTLEVFESKARDRSNTLVSALRYAENLFVEK